MRLRRRDRIGVEIWNDCTGCMCHEFPMVFGVSGRCDQCGCPKTDAEWDAEAKLIAATREEWNKQAGSRGTVQPIRKVQ